MNGLDMGTVLVSCLSGSALCALVMFLLWLSWRAICDAENRWQGIRGSAQDITERKEIEATLRQSEARYRLLAENMVDVVWTLNPAGQFTYVSPSVLQLRGYTPEEVMQQTPEEAVCPGSLAALQAGMAQAFHTLHTGERLPPAYFQIEQPCKDGSTVWTEATGRAMYDELQRPVGIVGVTRDISERRKTEETLRTAKRATGSSLKTPEMSSGSWVSTAA